MFDVVRVSGPAAERDRWTRAEANGSQKGESPE